MSDQPAGNPAIPHRARAMTNEADFRIEQEKLGLCWTFLGFETEISAVNDWFRTELGGKSIFVQRFESGIRAYENRCAHRFYPLRNSDKGNGPVVCGFHHWRYNADGLALGIPNCQEMFGKTPREMNARLPEVEVGLHAGMIFGRFADEGGISLANWLGEGADILSGLFHGAEHVTTFSKTVASHWRPLIDISLDDYHIVAIHPSTFGKSGYLPPQSVRYFRFGAHSAYFRNGTETTFREMAELCRERRYFPRGYRVFQFFPNLIVNHVRAVDYLGDSYWFLLVITVFPEAHDRTRMQSAIFRMPFEREAGVWRRFARRCAKPWVNGLFKYFTAKVTAEDNEACEILHRAVLQAGNDPLLASLECRIGWFEEQYVQTLTGDGSQMPGTFTESRSG